MKYEDMLRNEIILAIQAIVGDDFHQTWFQQDGAALHYGRDVRAYLNTVFSSKVDREKRSYRMASQIP